MKIKEFLADPAKWTKGALAKRADGTTTPSCDPLAVCWCLMGAVLKCYHKDEDIDRVQVQLKRQIHARGLSQYSITSYNDLIDTSHEDILAICNAADV